MDIMTDSSVSSESVKDNEERQKARKKAKKLRARMNSRSVSFSGSSSLPISERQRTKVLQDLLL